MADFDRRTCALNVGRCYASFNALVSSAFVKAKGIAVFRKLRYLTAGMSLVAALSLVLVSVQAFAEANTGLALAVPQPAHPSSARTSLGGQVALRGRVLNAHGLGVSGAMVYLYAWPAITPGNHVERIGGRIPLRFVGRAASGANGHYVVRISDRRALATSAAPGGVVNVMARAAGTGIGFYSFSLRIMATHAGPVITPVSAPLTAILRISSTAIQIGAKPNDFCFRQTTTKVKNYRKA